MVLMSPMRFASLAAAMCEAADRSRPALNRIATVAAEAPKRSENQYAKMAEPMNPPAKASTKKRAEILAMMGRLSGESSRRPAGAVPPTREGSFA